MFVLLIVCLVLYGEFFFLRSRLRGCNFIWFYTTLTGSGNRTPVAKISLEADDLVVLPESHSSAIEENLQSVEHSSVAIIESACTDEKNDAITDEDSKRTPVKN